MYTFLGSLDGYKDQATTEAMTATLAMLTRCKLYMHIMLSNDRIFDVLDVTISLLGQFKDILRVQESCCVAIVCICAHESIQFNTSRRGQISKVFQTLTQSQEPTLLHSILSGILVLADKGVNEMLTKENLVRVTEIAQLYSSHQELTLICCAIFRLYSADEVFRFDLCSNTVLDFLFVKASCGDAVARELAAVTLCNLTNYEESCRSIVARGLVPLLPSLSCTDPAVQDIYVRYIHTFLFVNSFP